MIERTLPLAAALLLLVVSCADRSETTVSFPSNEAPRIVSDGIISLPEDHESPSAVDPRSGAFYFTRSDGSFAVSRVYRVQPGSEEAPLLALFSTGSYDAGATIHPDGETILFTSKRPTGDPDLPDDWNLWSAPVGSSEATVLPSSVNTPSSECCAVFAPDGSFLFSSDRQGSWDIYRARPAEGGRFEVTRLDGPINSEYDEWPSDVAADGDLILFSSIRPDGPGGDDVFAACRESGASDRWSAYRLQAPINTDAYEDSAMLTPDGRTLLWSSWRARPGGEERADVYSVAVEVANLPECPGI